MVALVLFGFFGLPPIVKARAIKELSERTGRAVTIERIRINPLVLSTTIEGLAIAEQAPGKGVFAGWRRLYVNFDSWSVLFGPPSFQEIALDGFQLQVAKDGNGGMNFDDIIARLNAASEAAPVSDKVPAKSGPPALAITKLSVTDASVSFDDASRERPYATVVGPLSFDLSDFHTVGDPNSPYQFKAVTAAGEQLAWRGTVSAAPIKSRGELSLTNIDLVRLSPYYHNLLKGELRSAFVDFSGRYSFALDDAGLPVLKLEDGAFALRDFRFGAPGVAEDAVALKRLAVNGIAADSTTLQADIGRVSVDGLALKIARDAEGIDLLRLVMPQTQSVPVAGQPSAKTPGPSPAVKLAELSITGMQVDAVDLTTPRRATHRIDDLRLTLRDLDSAKLGKLVPLTLEIALPQNGRIAVSGDVAAQPLAADLDVALDRVLFANASPYLEPFMNIRLSDGAIRAAGKATLHDGVATFAGDFGIAGFRSVDGKLAQDFLTWADFSITGIKASSLPLAFHADEIRFTDPAGLVRVEADGSLNIAQAGLAKDPTQPAPAEVTLGAAPSPGGSAPLPIAVTIGKFAFDNAAFRFEDRSITPAARGGITQFTGTITGLSSEALGRAEVDLKGKVDGVAPVSITGKLNPLGQPAFMDVNVSFKGIDLQPGAGPYVGKFAGRTLARGNLNVAVTAKLNDRKLDTSNVVTLDKFELGEKTNSPDATKLPVGLALALLRDTNGRIVIDLPVKGSLDDPSFKVGRVVVRVVVNILTKAATSPFSLLGAAFGGGGDELGYQEFTAGAGVIDEAGIKKLETVAKALNGRPALKLKLAGAYDSVADVNALKQVRLDQLVRSETWETRRLADPNTPPPDALVITPELRAGMIARLYAKSFPSEAAAAIEQANAVNGGDATATVVFPEAAEPPRRSILASELKSGASIEVGRLRRFAMQGKPAAAKPSPTPFPQYAPAVISDAATTPGIAAVPLEVMEARLAELIEIPEEETRALADSRAQAVRTWLLATGKVAPERVFMGPVTSKGARADLNLE